MTEESIAATVEELSAEAQSQDGDVASMKHPEEVIHGAADESKRQKAAAAASTDAPAPQQSQQECINYFLFFRYNHIAHKPYRAMHYLLVKVRVPIGVGEVVATGEVAYCHNGMYGEFGKKWYSSGFHGEANVKVRPNENLCCGVEFVVESVKFHYLGKNYDARKLNLGLPFPGRVREQIAYHEGRKHKNPYWAVAPGTHWAILSRCTPESHKDYDRVLHFLLNLGEIPLGEERAKISFWR